MKAIIAVLLCACLLAAQAQTNEVNQPQKPNVTLCEAGFVLLVVGLAGILIIKIYGHCPTQKDKVMVYIDKSNDGRATWTCIATNGPIVLNGTDPLEVYRDELTDTLAFYRARVKKAD